jgi:hypothetical protein
MKIGMRRLTMKRTVNWLLSGILFSGIAGLVGCGEAEEAYNCATICETYDDCADELNVDIDVTACTSECETEADESEDFKSDAEACQECIDQNASCVENVPCVNECAGVVPELAS